MSTITITPEQITELTPKQLKQKPHKRTGLTRAQTAYLAEALIKAKDITNSNGKDTKVEIPIPGTGTKALWRVGKDSSGYPTAAKLYHGLTRKVMEPDDQFIYEKPRWSRTSTRSVLDWGHDDYRSKAQKAADLAMRLYGHPAWAFQILEAQRDRYQNNYPELVTQKQTWQLSTILAELRDRAKGSEWEEPRAYTDDGHNQYSLTRAHRKFGEPLAPVGDWWQPKKEER